MKRKDFVKGKTGYIYSFESKNASKHVYIDEVEVEEYEGDGWGSVWNYPDEMSEDVEIKDVYYTWDEAKQALMKTLVNMMKECVEEL